MVANRGEIAIRILRAASELKINTVAIYTHEDRYSLHRFKADEAYQIGDESEPLKPYLNVDEIIALAKKEGVDAIHPGYGFLSENVHFARRCREEGIIFVGPKPEVMEQLGDKVAAKLVAIKAEVPVIQDSDADLKDIETALVEAEKIGYPVIIKAAAGGGGRGMRVIRTKEDLLKGFPDAKSEASKAFGDDTIFMEKFIDNPKHIEVQILADNHGNMVHLFERDCSVQRRFQKVVEIAPSAALAETTRNKLYEYAKKICKQVSYNNAGTVEFLVDADQNVYFIEVNPRVQVEHTITEEVTGIDIVRSQILIAKGYELNSEMVNIPEQDQILCEGFAIQCRVTTEDPENDFKPHYGTLIEYRNAGGYGIRLDEGSAYPGMKISPFFDSMIVKVTARGSSLGRASARLLRTLKEFRVRGVKTNIGFLQNVITNEEFIQGKATVKFLEDHLDLFKMPRIFDSATKTLKYLGDVVVNGNSDVKFVDPNKQFRKPIIPSYDKFSPYPYGNKDRLNDLGRDGFVEWLKNEKAAQFTDTTFRDGHQSLLATRVRTKDLSAVAESYAKNHPEVFSMEVWGGATFDVCMRFLKEDPWRRLQILREKMPNMLLQMLFRGSNGVGYKAYPDNLIEMFIEKSAENGIDIFRIFDSLNWVEAMKTSIRAVRERTNSLAEATICYTGDIMNPDNTKYTLQYYIDLAKQLEDEGAHILAVKDMAGLLKPYAAVELITSLKDAVDLPIHLHTHDTSSVQSATYLKAIEAGVDVVDVALGAMSGLTSQPNFNSVAASLVGTEREQKFDLKKLNDFSNYWEDLREYYYPFESGLKAGTAEVYNHEIPGGQYSNLRPQARALGLDDKFELVKENYAAANELFGDIVKVTPSSKVVGDMALFMTSNDLNAEDVVKRGSKLSFPESVKSLFRGELGQVHGGFPKELQKAILGDEKPFTGRPNEHLEPVDFEQEFEEFKQKYDKYCTFLDFLSYKLYPKVYDNFKKHLEVYGNVSRIPTKAFFYGMKIGEEISISLRKGKEILVTLLYVSEPTEDGFREVTFSLNGKTRTLMVKDHSLVIESSSNQKANSDILEEVGSPLQGRIAAVLVKKGQEVKENDALFVIEAMKMESTISAPKDGTVGSIYLDKGALVEQDDLVIRLD
ncbi:pyruvate carboxylase [Sediminitomix flava]|uniref:Pyruvate carboxylase n=2 Tax=Sediminitomix flava TaxID=379075 RepID=A0A315Z9K3_SEDFL|nr:pyruvate carboxylase [Sediminitomix flava]